MKQEIRHISQGYWRHSSLPYLELRSTYNSLCSYKNHSHEEFSIGAILDGSTQTTYKHKNHIVQKGDLVFIEPKQPHSCNPLSGQSRSYHMLYLNTDWCLDKITRLYVQQVKQIQCKKFRISSPKLFKLFLLLFESAHEQDIQKTSQILEALCFNIFSRFCLINTGTEYDNKLTQYVKLRLLDNLAEPPTLDDLACELNLRKETIIRTFGQRIGISPKAFLNNARIEEAKIRLKSGLDIVDIALHLGYSDQSHFHKTFINYTSATPKQYQKGQFLTIF